MKRYGHGMRGGYSHPRAQGSNNNIYAQPRHIYPINAHNGYNSNTHNQFPPSLPPPPLPPSSHNSIIARSNGYSNNNFVVTHRVQQQYSVEVLNPTEHQHHRQPLNNITLGDPNFPKQQVSPAAPAPPLNNNVDEIQEDSLATAVVPYTNGTNGSASNIPASSTTPPESCSAKPTSAELHVQNGGFLSDSKLEEYYKLLGKEIAKKKAENKAKTEALEKCLLDNVKINAQNQELQSQISSIEQERDNQTRNFSELIAHEQREAAIARQDSFTWRNNVISFREQLESQKVLLSDRDEKIKSLESQVADVQLENSEHMQRIRQLEQYEKNYQTEIHGKNNAIEQYKVEIRKKNDDLAKVDLRLKDKMKEMKQLDDEMNTLKKKLNMEILNEKKRANELEANVTDWKNKYKSVKACADGYKADKEKLEEDKAKLESTVNELNRNIERKDDEILQLTEERNSIHLKKEIADRMLRDQTDKNTKLKTEMDKLMDDYTQLSTDLEAEKDMKNRILQEQMDMYLRPTLLNQLIHKKMQTPQLSFVAPVVGQQPQLNSPGCSSPVASEEVSDPISAEQGCSDEKFELGHEDTPEVGRKRKHSTIGSGSNDDVRQKDLKVSGDSPVPIEQQDEKIESGSSDQTKGQEEGGGTHRLRVSSRRCSNGAVSSSANNNIPANVNQERSANIRNSSVNGATRSDKARKSGTGKQEASIRIKIQNPNINFKKTK